MKRFVKSSSYYEDEEKFLNKIKEKIKNQQKEYSCFWGEDTELFSFSDDNIADAKITVSYIIDEDKYDRINITLEQFIEDYEEFSELGYSDVEIFLNTSVTDIMNKLVEKLKKR